MSASAGAGLRAFSYPGLDKATFLDAIAAHAAADGIIQGSYGQMDAAGVFRGCAVGCSLETVRTRLNLPAIEHGNHALFETYLGIPRMLARLEDRIFEGLPVEQARLWPMRFAAAVPPGADLSGVWDQFAPWLLRTIALPAARTDRSRKAILAVAEGFETNWATLTRGAAYEQADAAAAAAAAAADAAYAAAAAAAAYAADAAADAADAAAYAAADAAAYAAADAAAYAAADAPVSRAARARTSARHSAYITMSDRLCELISSAGVNEIAKS